MKRWGLFVVLFVFILSCESKKEKNAFLFILSFDPLEYFTAALGSGLTLDTSAPLDTGAEPLPAISAATIVNASGTGFVVSDAADIITTLDQIDTEAVVNLNDSGRQAFVSVAQQNVQSCAGLGLFSNVTCSLGGFIVDIGSVLSTATGLVSLQINGVNLDGDAVSSNILEARKYILRLVSASVNGITDAQSFVEHSDKLYFNANTDATNSFLIAYDGATLNQVVNLNGPQNDDAFPIASHAGQLLFRGNDVGAAYNLYSYNGTTVNKILDLNAAAGDVIGNTASFGERLYISAAGAGTSNIYRYNGTTFDQMTNDVLNSSEIVGQADDGVYYFLNAAVSTNDGIYRLNPNAAIPNRKVTDNTFDHTNSEYFVLNGKLYFTADYGGNDQTFMVDGDAVKRVSSFAMTGISVYNNVAYGVINEGGFNNLYRYTGTLFERLNPDSVRISSQAIATPVYASSSGVYFVRDTDTGGGTANELFRYNARRIEKLLSLETAIGAGTSIRRFKEFKNEIYLSATSGATDAGFYKLELQD